LTEQGGREAGVENRVAPAEARSLFSTESIVAITVGTALYVVLAIPFNILNLPSLYLIAARPAVAIPIAFGFIFGPIAGFFSGFLGGIITNQFSSGSFVWNWDLGNGLIGLIPALGYYTIRSSRLAKPAGLAACSVLAAVASVVGTGFASLIDLVSQTGLNTIVVTSAEFVPAVVTDVVNGAVLSPILVYSYVWYARRRAARVGTGGPHLAAIPDHQASGASFDVQCAKPLERVLRSRPEV
jgi:energy-coupling factor transport system substrate-specific component